MQQETSSSSGERIKFTGPDGEVALPKLQRGRYIHFTLTFDIHKDWRVIQLLYSLPPRERGKTIKSLLLIAINAAALAGERQPALALRVKGKKLTEEQVKKRLRNLFKTGAR